MAAIDPRMMDLVWTDRLEYEAVLYKRPACTQAEPTSTKPTSTKPVSTKPTCPKAETKPSTETKSSVAVDGRSLLAELEAARGFIRASLEPKTSSTSLETLQQRATSLETSNAALRKIVDDLTSQIGRLEAKAKVTPSVAVPKAPAAKAEEADSDDDFDFGDDEPAPAKPAAKPAAKEEESDDDDFGFDDDEDEKDEAPKESSLQKAKRLADEKKAAEGAKKKKAAPVLKSNVVLDIKVWESETDFNVLEELVRGIKMEGLTWGDVKLVEIGFGIKKMRMSTCIIDDLVGLYDLEEKITDLEDYVQSVDIVSHNKI